MITTTQQLALDQVQMWNIDSDTTPLLFGLAALIFIFGLLKLIKAIASWRVPSDD